MRLRIARKICWRLGYGYPIDNLPRLYRACQTWRHATKRFKHFKRDVKKRPHKLKKNTIKRNVSWYKKHIKL